MYTGECLSTRVTLCELQVCHVVMKSTHSCLHPWLFQQWTLRYMGWWHASLLSVAIYILPQSTLSLLFCLSRSPPLLPLSITLQPNLPLFPCFLHPPTSLLVLPTLAPGLSLFHRLRCPPIPPLVLLILTSHFSLFHHLRRPRTPPLLEPLFSMFHRLRHPPTPPLVLLILTSRFSLFHRLRRPHTPPLLEPRFSMFYCLRRPPTPLLVSLTLKPRLSPLIRLRRPPSPTLVSLTLKPRLSPLIRLRRPPSPTLVSLTLAPCLQSLLCIHTRRPSSPFTVQPGVHTWSDRRACSRCSVSIRAALLLLSQSSPACTRGAIAAPMPCHGPAPSPAQPSPAGPELVYSARREIHDRNTRVRYNTLDMRYIRLPDTVPRPAYRRNSRIAHTRVGLAHARPNKGGARSRSPQLCIRPGRAAQCSWEESGARETRLWPAGYIATTWAYRVQRLLDCRSSDFRVLVE